MMALSIPAFWRVSSESTEPGKDLELELWVFWFDERHTGKIDANDNLYALDGKVLKKLDYQMLIHLYFSHRDKSRLIYLGKCIFKITITNSITRCVINTIEIKCTCYSF